MIKRKNKMLVGILSFLLVITVGYALFSESLNINGTASAQGNFELTYECAEAYKDGQATEKCGQSIDPETGNEIITTTSTLTKPGESVIYIVKVTNTGTIPVVLKRLKSSNNVSGRDYNVPGDEIYFDKSTYLYAYYMVAKQLDSEGNEFGDAFYGDTEVTNANLTIQPGETLALQIMHMWHDSNLLGGMLDREQPALPEGGATMKYDLTLDFVQETTS